VRVNKFESDSQIRTEFGYDITFEVYDAKGRLLASNRVQELKSVRPLLSRLRLRPQEPPRHHPQGSGRRRLAPHEGRSDMSSNTSYDPFRVLLYPLLFSATALAGTALAETESVYFGKKEIRLPAPEGYFRVTGYSKRADQYAENFVPPSHRLLAVFGSEKEVVQGQQDKIPTFERFFMAESNREAENVNITSAQFAELKSGIRTQFSGDYAKIESETASLLSQRLQAQIDIKGQFGVFEETADSISWAGIVVYSEPNEEPWVRASAATAVKVGNRLLFILCD
jgi:hypothetical protein